MVADDRLRPADCPDAERLAQYAEGGLAARDRAAIEAHLADCADCRTVLYETMALANAFSNVDRGAVPAKVIPFRSRRWVTGVVALLAVAAALVLVVRVDRPEWLAGVFGPRSDRPELQELIAALANEPTRPVEGRLTGGFKYAPPPSPTRGAGDRQVSADVRLAAARLTQSGTASNDASAGLAYLMTGDVDSAIDVLERASRSQPSDASLQNDLAVAYLERARRSSARDAFTKALDASGSARRLDPTLTSPLFNRGLALEGLGRTAEAVDVWRELTAVEKQSPWQVEAAERLTKTQVNDGFTTVDGQPLASLFTASINGRFPVQECSATIVGPRTILTAAHCLSHSGEAFKLQVGDDVYRPRHEYTATCKAAETYQPKEGRADMTPVDDVALCRLDPVVPGEAFERVSLDPQSSVQGGPLLLTGFGCDSTSVVPDKKTGTFRIGISVIASFDAVHDDIVTKSTANRVSTCAGDSGSGAFILENSDYLKRTLVGVVSSSDQRNSISAMTNLASSAVSTFLRGWNTSTAGICGLDTSVIGCRK